MDHKSSKYLHLEALQFSPSQVGVRKGNPFVDSSSLDPLSKLNIKETSDFVRSFPVAKKDGAPNKRNLMEAPSTPGRPVFSFSVGNNVSRKNIIPSKWNDAEKWLVSDHDSTTHHHQNHHLEGFVNSADFVSRKSSSSNSNGFGIKHHHPKVVSEKTEEKVSIFHDHHHHNSQVSDTFGVLKDKFTNETEPNLLEFERLRKSLVVRESCMVHEAEVKSRDIGTEMTPLGSSTTSRCPTPFKSLSPPRHNTPAAGRSGPLDPNASLDIRELQECHLAKLKLHKQFVSNSNWSSREEEEEDISKSLRHFEMNNQCPESISSESNACAWEAEDKIKCCRRYQREEAKIQAWVDLETAKAEAQSRKLEVKIQKMRSKFEEKVMRKMGIVYRKAEELRATAKLEHSDQIQKATKMINQHISMHSCGCFSCSNNLHP